MNSGSGSSPQCLAEGRVSGIIGFKAVNPLHLDYKEHICLTSLLMCLYKAVEVLKAPLSGSVRKHCHALVFQGNALYLHERLGTGMIVWCSGQRGNASRRGGCIPAFVPEEGKGQIKSRIFIVYLSAYGFYFIISSQQGLGAGLKPFPCSLIRSLRIHVDQQSILIYRNDVVLGLAAGKSSVRVVFQNDCNPRDQKLPASSCVFYMANYMSFFYFYMGDKTVRAA